MKSILRGWNSSVSNVPLINPTANNTSWPDSFGIVSKKFMGTAGHIAGGGLSIAAVMSTATMIALAVTGVAVLIIGINMLDANKGKEIEAFLNKEPEDVKEK